MRRILSVLPLGLVLVLLLVATPPARALGQSPVTLSYTVIGGGSPLPPVLIYWLNGAITTATLTQAPLVYEIDYGSTWTVSRDLPGSNGTLRWEFVGSPSGYVGGSYSLVLSYTRQYLVTFGFLVVGSSKGMPIPKVNFTTFGGHVSLPAGQAYWVDFLSPYSYGNISLPWNNAVRWISSGATGVASGGISVRPVFFQQYLEALSLKTKGSDVLTSVTLAVTTQRVTSEIALKDSGSSVWVDAGTTLSFPNLVNSSSPNQRWSFHNATAIVAGSSPFSFSGFSSPMQVTLDYYEQFTFRLTFTISNGLAPSAPILSAMSNGGQISLALFPRSPPTWLDAGSKYSISSLLTGSSPAERWITSEETTGVAAGPTSIALFYYHQVQVSFSYTIAGGGVLPASDASFTDFGRNTTLPLGTSVSTVWADYGTNFTVPGGFVDASSGGRWILGSAPSLLLAGPTWLPLVYYHQYQLTIAYSVANGGAIPQPTFTGWAFGKLVQTSISSGTVFWLDSGGGWGVPQLITSGVTGERWVAKGATSGTVGTGGEHVLSYVHEFFISLSPNPQAGGTVSRGGWAAAGSTFGLSAEPNSGWKFAGWEGSGTDSYSGPNGTMTVRVSAPLQETANFDAAFTIEAYGRGTLVVSYDAKNYTVGNAPITLYLSPGSVVTVLAEPGLLSLFDTWTGISSPSNNPATVKVAGPVQMSGSFVLNTGLEYGLIAVSWVGAICVVVYVTRRAHLSFSSLRQIFARRR